MSSFTIVGGGQAGLQLAIGLRRDGHDVRVIQDRDADEIASGRVLSSQCMFHDAVQNERDVGLGFWDDTCPPVQGIAFSVPDPEGSGNKAIGWAGRLDDDAYSVDQRVKVPRWMAEFESVGGQLDIASADIDTLEAAAAESDLVIVAAGKGDIAKLFERDAERSMYDQPMRALALTYVTGMVPRPEFSAVSFNLIPGVGEYFVFPALTTTGPCEIMVFEGVPGGPMDVWGGVDSPDQHLAMSKQILETFLPWESERCNDVELTDDNGILSGRFPPTVRKPVGVLPSGATVLGLADAVVLNDPITGQGSNNASKATAVYLDQILNHDGAFDRAFMEATFERSWQTAELVTQWTNALLSPPPPHVLEIMGSAQAFPALAHRIANGFNDPTDFFPWFMDPDAAAAYLGELQAAG